MARSTSKLASVATPSIGGVAVYRHVLDLEAATMTLIMRRLGQRIKCWFRNTKTSDPSDHKVGSGSLPDEDARESIKLYTQGMLGLLKEQRERAKLTPKTGAVILDEATFEAELRTLVATTIRSMPDAELRAMLQEREVQATVVASMPVEPEGD